MVTPEPTAKLREAMLYVALRCEDDADFGVTKLYKMLFFAEASFYRDEGRTLTGHSYVRMPFGPMPKLGAAQIAHLEADGAARQVTVSHPFGGTKLRRLKALRSPNTSLFSPEEMAHLDAAIAFVKPLTAKAASEVTHEMPIWRWANPQGKLDFSLLNHEARITTGPVPDDLLELALSSAREQGLV